MFSSWRCSDRIRSATPQVPIFRLELLMSRNLVAVTGVTVLLGLALACTSNSSTPLTPTTPAPGGTPTTAADGSTLKVSAPVTQSPVGGVKPSTGPATLVVSAAAVQFAGSTPLQYR